MEEIEKIYIYTNENLLLSRLLYKLSKRVNHLKIVINKRFRLFHIIQNNWWCTHLESMMRRKYDSGNKLANKKIILHAHITDFKLFFKCWKFIKIYELSWVDGGINNKN